MKTAELTGAALDWAVAQAQGLDYEIVDGTVVTGAKRYEANSANDYCGCEFDEVYAPSTDWAQAGAIIEREFIELLLFVDDGSVWFAHLGAKHFPLDAQVTGPTPLIAAMRCYVASKLGEEIEIPEELI